MSFWEELGQKLTQNGQEVMQKTREIAGVVTMNADISDSKRKIRDLYAELGELVVNEAFEGMSAEAIKQVLGDEHADDKNIEIVLRNWKAIYSKAMFIRSEQEVIAINEATAVQKLCRRRKHLRPMRRRSRRLHQRIRRLRRRIQARKRQKISSNQRRRVSNGYWCDRSVIGIWTCGAAGGSDGNCGSHLRGNRNR